MRFNLTVKLTLLFLVVFGVVALPTEAKAQSSQDLQKKIRALEQKLKGYDDLKKELESLKDMVKSVQKEQKAQQEEMAEVKPLKKTLEELSKVKISGGATGVIQGTRNAPLGEGGDEASAEGSIDLVFEYSPMEDWIVVLDLEAVGGNGPGNLTTLAGLNDDAGTTNDNVTILEAYLEGTLFGGRATVTAGKIDITNYIDGNAYAGDETSQFLSSAFVHNNVFTAPPNGPGVRVRADAIPDLLYFEAGLMAQDSDGNTLTTDRLFEDVYGAAEVGVTPKPFGRPGNYRLWFTMDGAGQKRGTSGQIEGLNALGIGLSADQELVDWLGVFFRIGGRDSANLNYNTKAAWSFGTQLSKIIPSRPDDVIGFAYGRIIPVKRDFTGEIVDEGFFEAFYNWFFTEHFQVSGIFQYVMNPNANGNASDAAVFGVRGQANF